MLNNAQRIIDQIKRDMERIAARYAPSDIVVADLENGVEDEKIMQFLDICDRINRNEV